MQDGFLSVGSATPPIALPTKLPFSIKLRNPLPSAVSSLYFRSYALPAQPAEIYSAAPCFWMVQKWRCPLC